MNHVAMPDERRRNRGGSHHKWVNAVISRDKETCQHCGIKEVELHAHHIKSYKHHPEVRFDVSNGITLCYKCHWKVHAVQHANSVNSVKTQTDKAVGDTEPSLVRNYEEGVTDRGRAYRRWNGKCDLCGAFISKRLSDTTDRKNLFCGRRCATKFLANNRTLEHRLNISKANSGKKAGAEQRANMSAAQYRRQANARAVNPPRARGAKAMSCPELHGNV